VIDLRTDGVTIIRLFGEQDRRTAEGIKTEITRAAQSGAGVAVSLADATVLDSSLIEALVVGDRRLAPYGRRLALHVEPGSLPDRILELARLNEVLRFSTTLDEAVLCAQQAADADTTPAP
jgi:anti-anti-sigma factor